MLHELAAAPSRNPLVPNWTEVIVGAIAFFIVFFALWKVLLPRIMKVLDERTEQIEGGLERAKELQADAQRLIQQYQAQLAEARHEAARAQIDVDRQQAFASLRTEIGILSVQLASKIVGESLDDEARQSRVVERFLAELDASQRPASGARASS